MNFECNNFHYWQDAKNYLKKTTIVTGNLTYQSIFLNDANLRTPPSPLGLGFFSNVTIHSLYM